MQNAFSCASQVEGGEAMQIALLKYCTAVAEAARNEKFLPGQLVEQLLYFLARQPSHGNMVAIEVLNLNRFVGVNNNVVMHVIGPFIDCDDPDLSAAAKFVVEQYSACFPARGPANEFSEYVGSLKGDYPPGYFIDAIFEKRPFDLAFDFLNEERGRTQNDKLSEAEMLLVRAEGFAILANANIARQADGGAETMRRLATADEWYLRFMLRALCNRTKTFSTRTSFKFLPSIQILALRTSLFVTGKC